MAWHAACHKRRYTALHHATGYSLLASSSRTKDLVFVCFISNCNPGQVNENTELLVRYRDNILTILNQMNSMTGVMQQMPPLPVRLNVELANNFLPKAGSGNLFPQGAFSFCYSIHL